jgi:predicted phage terminase large subunit-like protein
VSTPFVCETEEEAAALMRMRLEAESIGAAPVIRLPSVSLRKYMEGAWHVPEPTTPFVPNFHVDAVCDHLEAVSKLQIRKLCINIPPGFAKSLMACVFWFTWAWHFRPSSRWIFSSYNQDFATRDSLKSRSLINSQWYQDRYGEVYTMRGDRNLQTYFQNDKTGYRIAMGVGGGTGGRGDVIVCLWYNTPVTTDRGRLPIGEIVTRRLPVKVLAYDHKSGEHSWQAIEEYEESAGRPSVKVRFGDGREIEATEDHPFYVGGRGYIRAGELRSGDEVLTDEGALHSLPRGDRPPARALGAREGRPVLWGEMCRRWAHRLRQPRVAWRQGLTVESVEPLPAPAAVYNVRVARLHNYFANGVLVHNCDDPTKIEDADSDRALDEAYQWWTGTMSTRGNDPATVCHVIIMQRLNVKDLTGRMLALKELGYDCLALPMEYQSVHETARRTSIGFRDPRTVEGELLFPARYPEPVVQGYKVSLGPHKYAGQMQQEPTARGGDMFQGRWFKRVQEHRIPLAADRVRYWDKAGTDETEETSAAAAWTVGALVARKIIGRIRDPHVPPGEEAVDIILAEYYIEDVIWEKLSWHKRENLIRRTAAKDAAYYGEGEVETWVEQEPGSGGKESAQITIANLKGHRVKADPAGGEGDKVTRARPFADQAEAGNFYIKECDWTDHVLRMFEQFPRGGKDFVDAVGGAFRRLAFKKKKSKPRRSRSYSPFQ